MRKYFVTDHALLRHMERAMGLDVEDLRRKLVVMTQHAALAGANSIVIGGFQYCFAANGADTVVCTTVLDPVMRAKDAKFGRKRTMKRFNRDVAPA